MDDTTRGVGEADDRGAAGAPKRRAPRTATGTTRTAKTTPAATGHTDLDPETDARAREVQAEIAETRGEISETVEAIQEKLRPSTIVAEGTEAVKTAATERVRDMADTARDSAYGMMETTRQNPWPLLMIGAGFAWLLLNARDSGNSAPRYQMGRYRRAGWNNRMDDPTGNDARDNDWSQYSEYADIGGYRRGQAMSGGTRSWGDDTVSSVRTATRRAQTGLQRMLHDNPLLVAAAAVLTGAAVGGALPLTDKENELMGEARDQVVDRAQGAAREAADNVRDVASAVQQVARDVTHPSQR